MTNIATDKLTALAALAYPYPTPANLGAVRYHGSIERYRGHTFTAEECWCVTPGDTYCDGWELVGQVGDQWVEIRHSRRTSFTTLEG